jgi:malonyl-CoA/methylmalonyl-CoA synthetase
VAKDEAQFFVKKSKQVLLLSAVAQAPLAKSIIDSVNREGSGNVRTLAVLENIPREPICSPMDMVISSDPLWDDNRPGVVIFTSGTTGRPKGAVMRRSYIHEAALAIGGGYDLDYNDVLLHVLPVHHTTGLGTSFFPYLAVGACIEFKGGSFNAAAVWERWLQGGITMFSGVPTIFLRLQWHFEREIAKMPAHEVQKYVTAANQVRTLKCGSSALQRSVQEFWTKLRNGRPILTRYGASEFPGCIKVPSDMDPKDLPPDCVGMAVPGVELKLTEGDHGELLVRSPYMFSK